MSEDMASQNNNIWAGRETIQDSSALSHFVYNKTQNPLTSPRVKPKNVILFGETGSGKSSIINLMAARNVAHTSSDTDGCTLDTTEYAFTMVSDPDMLLHIFDTVGLEEPEMGVNTFFGAIEKAHHLITTLHNTGGIDLLLFCIKGGRLTNATHRNYRLFSEILCDKQVPLAIVVTHLENESVMEDWWTRNGATFTRYGMHPVAHACIAALPAHVTLYAKKRAQSQDALLQLFHESLNVPKAPYLRAIRSWIAAFVSKFWSFLTGKKSLKKKDIAQRLETDCGFRPDDAQRLVEMITSHNN